MAYRADHFASAAQPLITDDTRTIIAVLVSYCDYENSTNYRGQNRFLNYQETPERKHKTKPRNKAELQTTVETIK